MRLGVFKDLDSLFVVVVVVVKMGGGWLGMSNDAQDQAGFELSELQ